jgi:hypothetical protein
MKIQNKSYIDIKINIKQKLLEGHVKLNELLNSTNWNDIHMVKGIESKIMYLDNMIPIVYCKSIIQCPPKELFDYLVHNISETCHEWNNLMYHSSILHQFDDMDVISRISNIISTGYPAADREDVFLHLCDKDSETYYELSFGIDSNMIPLNISNQARNPNTLVRSDMHFAAKKITINKMGCEYITIWHYDPMGWLSKFIPRKILGNIILKNLVHEHEKLTKIYNNKSINDYSFMNSILTSFINRNVILFILMCLYFLVIKDNIFIYLEISENIVSYIFYNNMFWSLILFIGCIASPKLMIRINSVPWAFHPSYNTDIAYQTVLYIALHEKSINILSHLTIASDSIFWFIILLNIHNVVFPLFSILLLLQAYSIYIKTKSLPFIITLLCSWIGSITIAYTIGNYIGMNTMQHISIIFISISAFMRVITHSVEQIPPGVASILYTDDRPKYDIFKKYKDNDMTLGKKSWLLMCFLQGYTAEFISSLPCRLFIVHVFYLADKIGIKIPSIGSWNELKEHAIAIRNNGWKASPYTKWMYEWMNGIM